MCGYCIEQAAFVFLQANDRGSRVKAAFKVSDPCVAGYMQDCFDLNSNLALLSAAQIERPEMEIVLCCRAIALLLEAGYASVEYQALLAWPFFARVVDKFCTAPHWRDDRPDWLPELRDRRIFFDPHHLVGLIASLEENWAGRTLLRYVDAPKPPEADTAIPALWLALQLFPKQEKARWSVLMKVALQACAASPEPNDFSLWLQRKALLAIYDYLGPPAIISKLFELRPALLQFLALMRPLSSDFRTKLLKKLDSKTNKPDHASDYFSLRTWLTDGDLQIALLLDPYRQ